MMDHIANHCEELHRRHVHILTVAIAVALSVGLYFVLPILLLAQEIAMATPMIHRFKVANAEDYQYASSTVPVPPPAESASGPCPAGQYLGKTEKGEAQCMLGAAPGTGGTSGNQVQPQEKLAPENGDEPMMDEEFVDPKEVKKTLGDIKQMRSQLKQFAAKLKKVQNTSDDLAKISEIQTAVADYENRIKNPSEDESLREVLREFYNNNYWEEIQAIRAKVEIPTELARFNKDLVRVQKLVGNKTYIKLGFDMTALGGRLDEISVSIKEIQDQYSAGDLEAAMYAMEDVRNGGQPGEIYGVLTRTRDILQRTKSIRSKDIQNQITEIIQPVIDSFNAGDYHDGSAVLDQISQELMQLQSKMMKMSSIDNATNAKLQKLQATIEERLGKQDGGDEAGPPDNVQP